MGTDAQRWVPERPTIPRLEKARRTVVGASCGEPATQVVFSAGRVLIQALEDAGSSRDAAYLINAVKHSASGSVGSGGSTRRGKGGWQEAYDQFVSDLRTAVKALD